MSQSAEIGRLKTPLSACSSWGPEDFKNAVGRAEGYPDDGSILDLLECAIAHGYAETVEWLVRRVKHIPDTALHYALSPGPSVSMVGLLLGHGAPMALFDGKTPLHRAAWLGNAAACALLVENGASIDEKCARGLTALHWAARGGHDEATQTLLFLGADVHTLDAENMSALDHASGGGYEKISTLLACWEQCAILDSKVPSCSQTGDVIRL